MKILPFIPPVVAVAIVGTWLASQHRTFSDLERETIVLRERLDRLTADGEASSRADAAEKSAKDARPIDWRKFAGQIEGVDSESISGIRALLKLQQRLATLDRDELAAAVKEIGALDLPEATRSMILHAILEPLIEKDPELAVTSFSGIVRDQDRYQMSWDLSLAWNQWVQANPSAAAAWLDQQLAAGNFTTRSLDGNNPRLLDFEGALVGRLLSTDPATARLAAIPEEQRARVISNGLGRDLGLRPEDQAAFADLVRGQIPSEEQKKLLANWASNLAVSGGAEGVSQYLSRINATVEEREACVERAAVISFQQKSASKPAAERIDGLREWTRSEAPGVMGNVTGKALAEATMVSRNRMDFAEASALALRYQAADGGDDVIVGFLNGATVGEKNRDKAIELAGRISDETRRNKVLGKLK